MLLTRSAGASLSQQVYSILQKYGTDAHVYLPGIGVINGLTAGNYLESTGITAATVDNPVGLVVDSGGINAIQATTANKPILRYASGKYYWSNDSTDVLTATFPAGYESATIINTAETGQVTYTAQNIVGTYGIRGAVIGADVIVNGRFATNSDWAGIAGMGGTAVISGGVLTTTRTSGLTAAGQALSFVSGKTYEVNFRAKRNSGTGVPYAGIRTNNDSVTTPRLSLTFTDVTSDFTNFQFVYTCANTETAFLQIGVGTANAVIEYDDVTLKESTTKEYGRFVFKTITASELAIVQSYCNRLAGV